MRRRRDSNPRIPFGIIRFPGVRTRPLCDFSLIKLLKIISRFSLKNRYSFYITMDNKINNHY